jgi:hypothetical protein
MTRCGVTSDVTRRTERLAVGGRDRDVEAQPVHEPARAQAGRAADTEHRGDVLRERVAGVDRVGGLRIGEDAAALPAGEVDAGEVDLPVALVVDPLVEDPLPGRTK